MSATYDRMVEIAACLQVTLDDAGRSACLVDVQPGDAIAPDLNSCGTGACSQAWVRLGTAYPANDVGIQLQGVNNCTAGLGLDLEVGVLRCYSVDREGRPVNLGQMAQGQIEDMDLMFKAITCCDALPMEDYALGTYSPIGPLGGVIGGSWVLHVGLI